MNVGRILPPPWGADSREPRVIKNSDGAITHAECQCGDIHPIAELSCGYAGWTEINKPCYFCSECIPF